MKKIITLMLLIGGFVCTASAWNDDVYLRSSIDNWSWDTRLESWKKFTREGNSDAWTITLDRTRIGSNILYFSILFEASQQNVNDIRPNDGQNAPVSTSQYDSWTSASAGAFYVELYENTEKIQIHVKTSSNNGNHWYITVAQLREYTITWDNTNFNWNTVYCYSFDENLNNHPKIEWLGGYPGSSNLTRNGNLYTATIYGTSTAKAIFSDGTQATKTLDLTSANNGIYDSQTKTTPSKISATISSAGIGTFSSDFNVIPTSGVTASYITGIDANNVLTTTNFSNGIPANSGALLQGEAGTYQFSITDTQLGQVSGNKLVAVVNKSTISQTENGNFNYILTTKTVNGTVSTPMFFLVNSAGNTVTGGHAYLQLSSAVSAREYFPLWEETNSITNPNQSVDNSQPMYDLQGRRVQQPTKGLYIVNGKKVIK